MILSAHFLYHTIPFYNVCCLTWFVFFGFCAWSCLILLSSVNVQKYCRTILKCDTEDLYKYDAVKKLLHTVESENVKHSTGICCFRKVLLLLYNHVNCILSFFLFFSRCHQLNRQHPLEVHLPFLAPWCYPPQACLQEELLLSPQTLTLQRWQQVRHLYNRKKCGFFNHHLKETVVTMIKSSFPLDLLIIQTLLFCNVATVLSLMLLL